MSGRSSTTCSRSYNNRLGYSRVLTLCGRARATGRCIRVGRPLHHSQCAQAADGLRHLVYLSKALFPRPQPTAPPGVSGQGGHVRVARHPYGRAVDAKAREQGCKADPAVALADQLELARPLRRYRTCRPVVAANPAGDHRGSRVGNRQLKDGTFGQSVHAVDRPPGGGSFDNARRASCTHGLPLRNYNARRNIENLLCDTYNSDQRMQRSWSAAADPASSRASRVFL
jgi:hypothetical protein